MDGGWGERKPKESIRPPANKQRSRLDSVSCIALGGNYVAQACLHSGLCQTSLTCMIVRKRIHPIVLKLKSLEPAIGFLNKHNIQVCLSKVLVHLPPIFEPPERVRRDRSSKILSTRINYVQALWSLLVESKATGFLQLSSRALQSPCM